MNLSAIVKPYAGKVFQQNNIYCLYDDRLIENFTPEMLDSQYWQDQNAVTGSAQGRGTTWFVKRNNHHWVLRHYYRGGMVGRVNKDTYLFRSLESTRAAREYALLNLLQQLKLPAPKPIAYRVTRHGKFYRADLLTAKIDSALDLVALLKKGVIEEQLWPKIGQVIKAFHDQGIYHHDLNAHNILIDEHNEVWLIDFDRGEQREISSSWQQSNLSRLLRSFHKEAKKNAQFHWQESHWQQLLNGYQN